MYYVPDERMQSNDTGASRPETPVKPYTCSLRQMAQEANLDIDGKRHDEQCDHDVGDGERDDEEVGGRVKTTFSEDGETDESVAEQRHDRQQEKTQRPVAWLRPPTCVIHRLTLT